MAKCVNGGCVADGLLHLFAGEAGYPISLTTEYTGASFCSWAHLSEWVRDPRRDQHFEVPEFPEEGAGRAGLRQSDPTPSGPGYPHDAADVGPDDGGIA